MEKLPPPNNPIGYTRDEMKKHLTKKQFNKFCKNFGVQTCAVDENGKVLMYPYDVERALVGLPPLD